MGNAPFNLGPDAAQDPRLQALMAMIAQNQGAQPSGLPGGAPAPTQPPPPRFTMSAAGPSPDVPESANPAPSFLQRLAGSFFGIPGDASPDVRRAAMSRGLMATGLQMMHDSYGVPGQAAPSFGKSLTQGLISGQAVTKDYLATVPDQEAQNILQSINWTDTSPTGLQGAALGLMRVGKVKEAGVIIDLLKEMNAKQTAAHQGATFTAQDANGNPQLMTRDASGRAVPVTDAQGHPVRPREAAEANPLMKTNDQNFVERWDKDNNRWINTGMKAPPRMMDAFSNRVSGVASTINGYMADLEKYTSNPGGIEAAALEIAHEHPRLSFIRGAAGASAQIQDELYSAFGEADALRAGRGGPSTWRENGKRFVPVASDQPETRASKLRDARALVQWINDRNNQNSVAARLLTHAVMTGMDTGAAAQTGTGTPVPEEP